MILGDKSIPDIEELFKMKNDWELSFGTVPGLLFGVRSYKDKFKTNYVFYLLFVDVCLAIYND